MFDEIPDKKEQQENPEVRTCFNDLGHYLGHFTLKSVMFEKYNSQFFGETKKNLSRLLSVCKNSEMVIILRKMEEKINDIDVNSPIDNSMFDELNRLLNELGSKKMY
ncbi:MAG: hypothetical protein AAB933_02080 [Patescibacteria group bacterium]